MEKPVRAPACFSAATVYSGDSDVCKACIAFQECGEASLETLNAIKGIINVDDLLKRHEASRKKALVTIQQQDEAADAALPPGNNAPPLPVKPLERKTKQVPVTFEVSPDEAQVIMKMRSNLKEIAYRMLKSNDIEGIREALAEGRNFYAEKGSAFMRVAITMLIEGGFTLKTLKERYMAELGWSEGTAASQAGMAKQVLVGFKLARERMGIFTIAPKTAS